MNLHSLVTLLWLRMETLWKFRQSKGNNSIITDDIPIYVHNLIMVIYIQYKCHEFSSIGYIYANSDGLGEHTHSCNKFEKIKVAGINFVLVGKVLYSLHVI